MERELSTYPRDEREILERFRANENGTDCTFEDFPQVAKTICKQIFAKYETYNEVRRAIDRSDELRLIFQSKDENMREVDAILRYWSFREGQA